VATSSSSKVALKRVFDHVKKRKLSWASDLPDPEIDLLQIESVPLHRPSTPLHDFASLQSWQAYGQRWFFRASTGRWKAVDAVMENGRIIACILHPPEIAESWVATLRALKKRKHVREDKLSPRFLRVPAYRLDYVSFVDQADEAAQRSIALNGIGRAAPRSKWLMAEEVERHLANAASEFRIRLRQAMEQSRTNSTQA
jgi:hypothetical protein